MMSKIAVVFPGQGSQFLGMGKDIYDRYDEIKDLFSKAESIINKDIKSICFDGPENVLAQTENTQPAIFLVSIALFQLLQKSGIRPVFLAGHSLGEISAYYAAGVLDLETALKLIEFRGKAMASSTSSDIHGMAAVIGGDVNTIKKLTQDYSMNHQDTVVVANYNSLEQVVISGTKTAITGITPLLTENGIKRVIPLPVSGAFHSPFMEKASESLSKFIESLNFMDAKNPIVLNRTASPEQNASNLKTNLALQVKSSVLWIDTIQFIQAQCDVIIECGPGKVLSGLIRKINKDLNVQNVSNFESLEKIFELHR